MMLPVSLSKSNNTIEIMKLTNNASVPEKEIAQMWAISADKLQSIFTSGKHEKSAPVFTVEGKYTARGWTEWTHGFHYGSALLQYEATDDTRFLTYGCNAIDTVMAPHVTHFGVHDHGFNSMSTYGSLLRLFRAGRADASAEMCLMALKCSGAVQAMRWIQLTEDEGYIYSFNGPHSLFIDTIRSLRVLAAAHLLGHVLKTENDKSISLLNRLCTHLRTTAKYNVYYGHGRDAYDVNGRVAHESIFNINDGMYRCPNSQQGYSPFTTWTRGLAWAILGFAEQCEFLHFISKKTENPEIINNTIEICEKAARATATYYFQITPTDGIPYWDSGAPGCVHLGDYTEQPADPFNQYEPVDSSAAAIAAQGFWRLGHYFAESESVYAAQLRDAACSITKTLLSPPYISTQDTHQGLLLHSVYHRPNGWDYIPDGHTIPCGESSMWGDYHLRELALCMQRENEGKEYLTFWQGLL